MVEHDSAQSIRRREFLHILGGGAAVLLIGDVLFGCGGGNGGGEGGSRTFPTKSAIASVNQTQIGGNGLQVLSIYQNSSIGQNGTATIQISSAGAQLQVLADAAGNIRATAVTNGALQGDSPTVVFDAMSTALALVFLTPGILTVDSTEATTRIAQIKGLSSFTPIVNYMTQNLRTTPLNTILTQDALNTLLRTCIGDFLAQITKGVSAHPKGRTTAPAPQFTAAWGPSPTYAINVTNSGLRFDSIVKQDLLPDLSENGQPTLLQFHTGLASELSGVLSGASPTSWGSIVTSSTLEPANDSVDVNIQNDNQTAIVRLWIYGPGFAGAANTPADVDVQFDKIDAWGQSIIYYLVFPLIDFRLGKAALLGKEIKIVSDVWTKLQAKLNLASFLDTFQNGTLPEILAALVDLIVAAVGVAVLVLTAAGIEIPATLAGLAGYLTFTAVVFAVANLHAVYNLWAALPSSSSFDLVVSNAGITVK